MTYEDNKEAWNNEFQKTKNMLKQFEHHCEDEVKTITEVSNTYAKAGFVSRHCEQIKGYLPQFENIPENVVIIEIDVSENALFGVEVLLTQEDHEDRTCKVAGYPHYVYLDKKYLKLK